MRLGVILHLVNWSSRLATGGLEHAVQRTLPGVARRHSYIACVASFNHVVQCLHSLLDWCVPIESVACGMPSW